MTHRNCDGCARHLPIDEHGNHRGESLWDIQGCTADRYAAAPIGEQLSRTAAWLEVKAAAIDELTHRLTFATNENPPRLHEIRRIRELLDLAKSWNVLRDTPGKER